MSIANNNLNSAKKTTDYNIFKVLPFQRPVSSEHVHNLQKSIKETNLLIANPIIVDKNFYVIDGQHRLQACRNLKFPVYYYQLNIDAIENPRSIININMQERWHLKNYIEYYAKLGYEEYIRFLEWIKKYNCPATIIFYLAKIGLGHNPTIRIRNGELRFVEDAEEFLKIFMNYNQEAKDYMKPKDALILNSQTWAAAHYYCFKTLGNRYASFLEHLKKGLPGLIGLRHRDNYIKYFELHANKGLKQNRYNLTEGLSEM